MSEVVSVNNSSNNYMHNGQKPVVGIIVPPDKLPNKILFSAMDELRHFKQIEADMYQGQLNTKPHKKGLPKIIKIALGAVAIWLAYAVLKEPAINKFRKIFHK